MRFKAKLFKKEKKNFLNFSSPNLILKTERLCHSSFFKEDTGSFLPVQWLWEEEMKLRSGTRCYFPCYQLYLCVQRWDILETANWAWGNPKATGTMACFHIHCTVEPKVLKNCSLQLSAPSSLCKQWKWNGERDLPIATLFP